MVKTFRKLAALTAAVALVSSFAVCASAAVTVNMTTSYVDGNTISVTAVVSADDGELSDAQVTYYATDTDATATGGVVYMDQKPATNGSATFTFKTDAAYIGSDVIVGYTDADAAVTGNTIPAATEYCNITVTGPNGSASTTFVKGADPDGQYTVMYTPTAGKYVSALQVTGGAVTIVTAGANSLTFTLSNFVETSTDITITATESYNATGNETGRVVNAGGIISAGEFAAIEGGDNAAYENFKASAGDRKLTVIGQVTGLAEGAEYGVIVTPNGITEGDVATLPAERVYAAKGKDTNGYFAVQLIDTNDDVENADFIKPGVEYHTAVYYQAGNVYKIVKSNNTVTIPVAQ